MSGGKAARSIYGAGDSEASSPASGQSDAQTKEKDTSMWYSAWILGLPLAAAFAVLNAMWYELMDDEAVRVANASPNKK